MVACFSLRLSGFMSNTEIGREWTWLLQNMGILLHSFLLLQQKIQFDMTPKLCDLSQFEEI